MQGINVGSRDRFEELCAALTRHRLRPVVDATFPFEQAPAAYARLRAGGHFGKLVIAGT